MKRLKNKTMPKVSVIVPVYKVEEYIGQCIESILSQTFNDFELILVDDGSPDSSGAICDQYAQKDSRIQVIHKENGGVSSARNTGIENASGQWIYFVDSDDWVETTTLKLLYEQTEKVSTDLVLHGLSNDYIYKNQIAKNKYTIIADSDYKQIIEETDKWGLLKGPVCKLFKSSIINNGNIKFDTSLSYGEDTKFSFEYLALCNSISFIPRHLYHYCFRGEESLTRKKYDFEFWIQTAFMLKNVRMPVIEMFNMPCSYRNYINQVYLDHILRAIFSLYEVNEYSRVVRIKKLKSINFDFLSNYKPYTTFHKLYKLLLKSPMLTDLATPIILRIIK